MLAALWLLADAASEGKKIVISMLVVGLIFLGVIVFGQLARYIGHRRAARRAHHRAY